MPDLTAVGYVIAVALVSPVSARAPGEPIGFVVAQGPMLPGDRAIVCGVCRMEPRGFWQAAEHALREP